MQNKSRIAIISDSDNFIPIAGALTSLGCQVLLFFSPSQDNYINEKVSQFCKQFNIQITIEKTKQDIYKWLDESNPYLIFISGYSNLLDINRIKNRDIFNIHYGQLPQYRGPSPVFWQIKNGEKELYVTIHKINEKFDNGAVIWQKSIQNQNYLNYKTASIMLSQVVVEGVIYIIRSYYLCNNVTALNRDETKVSKYYSRPKLEDVKVNWDSMTVQEILNLTRACNPWNKGAIAFFKQNEIKLISAHVSDSNKTKSLTSTIEINNNAGTIVSLDDGLVVVTSDKQFLSIDMVYYMDSYIGSNDLKFYNFSIGDILN